MPSIASGLMKDIYKLAFSVSPIILTGGIASSVPGGCMPIVSVMQGLTFATQAVGSLVGQGSINSAVNPFATFEPVGGSNLIATQLASYPFASRAVAGNAQITVPLQVGMRMIVPAQGEGGYALKTATMMALKLVLDKHIAQGGLFSVLTPSYIYNGCILMDLRDATGGQTKQKQVEWHWQFQQPLTQEDQLTQVMSNLMGKISGGLPTNGAWSSISNTVGSGINSAESALSTVGGLFNSSLSSVGSAIGL